MTGLDVVTVRDSARGDGVADDSAAFSKALTAASAAGGGIVSVDIGTYLLNSNVVVPATVTLQIHSGVVFNGAGTVTANAGGNILDLRGGALGIASGSNAGIDLSSGTFATYAIKLGSGQLIATQSGSLTIRAGSAGSLILGAAGLGRWQIDSTATGSLLAIADNTYDIGQSSANRPRAIYTGAAILAGTQVYPGAEAGGNQASGGILHSTGVPSNTNGNNNDWCISDNGHLYFKSAGSWAQKI